jgi:hypothetical protein
MSRSHADEAVDDYSHARHPTTVASIATLGGLFLFVEDAARAMMTAWPLVTEYKLHIVEPDSRGMRCKPV